MKELLKRLEKHKCKHNLHFEFNEQDYEQGDTSISLTIFNDDYWNGSIYIYSHDTYVTIKDKTQQIKKLLNNKRKALLFIGDRPEGY